LAGVFAALSAAPAFANDITMPATSGNTGQYVNFATTTAAGHYTYGPKTFATYQPDVKFLGYSITNPTSVARCIDIETGPPIGIINYIVDTRIWVELPDHTFRSLSDDQNGGVYSAGRIYLGPNQNLAVYAAVYSNYWNSAHFKVNFSYKQDLSTSQCINTNQIPVVQKVDGVVTFSPLAN
jgi:hypothetical protein